MKLFELATAGKVKVVEGGIANLNGKTFEQHPIDKREGMKLVLIETELLETLWKRSGAGWRIGAAPEYENQIKNRIQNFKDYYEKNDMIQVGDVHVRKNGVLGFGDGRHRTRVLIEMGFKEIPVSMNDESIQNLHYLTEDRTKAELIAQKKKNKAKRANPKATKTNNMVSSGSRPHDPSSGIGSSTGGTRYQGSQSSVNDG